MEITLPKLRENIRNLVSILDRERISSLKDLTERLDRIFPIEDGKEACVGIELRPSNGGTMAYTLFYTERGAGIPIELRVNPNLGYSTLIVKSEKPIPGYELFGRDMYGNLQQQRRLQTTDFPTVRKELESLAVSPENN